MNPNIKMLIGAAVGGAIGYFVANVVIEVIYLREQTDTPEELDEIDDGYGGVTEDEFSDKETFKRPTKMSTKEKNYTKHFISDDRPELRALVQKYQTGDVSEERVEDATMVNGTMDISDEFEMPEEDPDMPTDPSIITMQEFAANSDDFSTVTLHYFEDDVVTDEKNNPIVKPETLIGDEALFEFGEDDSVYVRNEAKKCLYEVIRMNKDYSAPQLSIQEKRRRAMKQEEENASEDSAS